MQRWHSKTHSPEFWDCGSSASNETHRWCMTRRVSEHPPPKCHLEASSAAFFHASPQLLWIQFKCKATEETRHLCLPRMYSICSWALGWWGLGPSPGPTHHTDRSIGSDWLLDPLGADLMRMDHPFLLSSNILPTSFSLFSLLLWFSVRTVAQTNVFAFFTLSQIQHLIVFRPIKRSKGILKFYY